MSDEENAALVIKTGIEQVFLPLQQLVDKLLGPAATEIGLSLGDSVKVWRFKRQNRLLQEVKRLIEQTGEDVNPIATRLFFPVLEAASIEDDDEMQTRWAALLANEATSVGSVHPSFIEILRQMVPDDARLLDKLSDMCELKKTRKVKPSGDFLNDSAVEKLIKSNEVSFDNLIRLGLIQADYETDMSEPRLKLEGNYVFAAPSELKSWYELSEFAVRFVHACRVPHGRRKPD